MEIVNKELRRHAYMLMDARKVIYSNPTHLRGIEPWEDKKRLHQLWARIRELGQLMTIDDLQYLESIHEKYSK